MNKNITEEITAENPLPSVDDGQEVDWDNYEFSAGEIFVGEYPPQAAIWCNNGGQYYIEEISPLEEETEEGEVITTRRYQITAVPEPTSEELAARILELSMTRSDFFDGMIKAFGTDSDDLLAVITGVLSASQLPAVEQKVAINNYKNALNFYRKHPLFTILSDIPIPLSENLTITITSAQWDKFFEETNKRNEEAYKYLINDVIENEDTTDNQEDNTEASEL